jgi:uncharacterized protein YjbI with pentapeptide repeats
MTELKMEHGLMLVIVVFVLYHFMGKCGCRNGFRVGGQGGQDGTCNTDNLNNCEKLIDKNCSNIDLSYCTFERNNFSNIDFSNSNLTKAYMAGETNGIGMKYKSIYENADFTNANLTGATLYSSDFINANFTDADLSESKFYNVFFSTRSQSFLRNANLTNASLTDADLSNVILTNASLTGADLSGADLSGADLSESNLTGANLSGATLKWVDLTDTNLTGATLDGVKNYNRSILIDIPKKCYKKLREVCPRFIDNPSTYACNVCCGDNQQQLMDSGCLNNHLQDYCKDPPP